MNQPIRNSFGENLAEVEFGEVTPGQGNMWDDPACPLSAAFVADMNAIGSVLPLAGRVEAPWLLVHGDADDVVPIEESREIFAAANQPKQLVELPGVGHVFEGDGLPAMIDAVLEWLSTAE